MLSYNTYSSFDEVDDDTDYDVEEYKNCVASMQAVVRLLQERIDREANSYANRVKRLMTDEEFAQVLQRVAHASNLYELGEIRHESPNWELMTEKMCTEFSLAVEARRVFLKEEQRVRSEEMSPYERAQYISMHFKSSDPYTQELVRIAREVQDRVTKDMTLDEIFSKSDIFAAYRSNKDKSSNKSKELGCVMKKLKA